jgi:anthranilate phosphoribosyltransferase
VDANSTRARFGTAYPLGPPRYRSRRRAASGRSVSSKSRSADLVEALGILPDLGPAQVARCVTEIGIGSAFTPNFHHAYRHAAPVRARGVPTAVNYLAPLPIPPPPRP